MKYSKRNLFMISGWLILAVVLIAGGCNNQNKNQEQGQTGQENKINNSSFSFNRDSARRHVMQVNDALKYTSRFRDSRKRLGTVLEKDPYFKTHPFKLLNGEYFNRDAIIALLNQAQSGGIRVYLGQDSAGTVKFVLVPASAPRKDVITRLIPRSANRSDSADGPSLAPNLFEAEVMERGQECPSMCPFASPFLEN